MNSDTSDFVRPSTAEVSPRFTDVTIIPSRGFNLMARAKRYGRWWVLKGLKVEFRHQTVYLQLPKKECMLRRKANVQGRGAAHGDGLRLCRPSTSAP